MTAAAKIGAKKATIEARHYNTERVSTLLHPWLHPSYDAVSREVFVPRFIVGFSRPLVLAALVFSACGSGRQLRSVSLSPPAADAQSFPSGQVPFVATGIFSNSPTPVTLTSKDVMWCIGAGDGSCVGNIKPGATVDQTGMAQCNSGFVGTATILAGKPASAMMMPDTGSQLKVFGAAKLTCP
jgi:hypothetical protein